MSGYELSYSSTSAFLVGSPTGTAGQCSDSTNTVTMTLASQATVTITTNGAISGNDAFTGPGTASVTSTLTAVVGVSTTFLTSFGTRAGVGTIAAAGITTVTGTGTFFLSTVQVGDLIGNTSGGYFQVTAIATDTNLTLVASATFAGGSSFNVIENPTVTIGTNTVAQVTAIATNLALTIGSGASGTQAGQAYVIGAPSATSTKPTTNIQWYYVWAGQGGSGTGCFASTQRTTPFGLSGYNTYYRYLGELQLLAGAITFFDQMGHGNEREYVYEVANGTTNLRILSSGSATSWTAVVGSGAVPPSAHTMNIKFVLSSAVGQTASLRKRNSGVSTTSRNLAGGCTASSGNVQIAYVPCDGAQCVDYVNSNGSLTTFLDVIGYKMTL